jgi:hypothetical protein
MVDNLKSAQEKKVGKWILVAPGLFILWYLPSILRVGIELYRLDSETAKRDAVIAARSATAIRENPLLVNPAPIPSPPPLPSPNVAINAFIKTLRIADPSGAMIKTVSLRMISPTSPEAEITVQDIWHLQNKQMRLQNAQNMWDVWAKLASPTELDAARIKILDLNGNEVGGSRIFAGSLIWVQD